jgi:hypothetical protein
MPLSPKYSTIYHLQIPNYNIANARKADKIPNTSRDIAARSRSGVEGNLLVVRQATRHTRVIAATIHWDYALFPSHSSIFIDLLTDFQNAILSSTRPPSLYTTSFTLFNSRVLTWKVATSGANLRKGLHHTRSIIVEGIELQKISEVTSVLICGGVTIYWDP